MIGALVRATVRTRPVGEGGRLAYGGYMELVWDPGEPYEVRLAEFGPYAKEVSFARELLASALAGHPAGKGDVHARVGYLPGVRDSLLLLSITRQDGLQQLALTGAKVARFVRDTIDLIPQGEEWRYLNLDEEIDDLLRGAA